MRLAASYNFFNGEEHLLASMRALRPCVDVVSIVWQEVSNAGAQITAAGRRAVQDAAHQGLVDEVIAYAPDLSLQRKENETAKRAIGLEAARRSGATHFLTLDADEFYRQAEFDAAKAAIQRHGWQSTSVESFLHIRRPVWRAHDVTCCCFITEIDAHTQIGTAEFPCDHVDPSRRMTSDPARHHHFEPDVVAMYHMNLVRADIDSKLGNTSTRNDGFLAKVRAEWETWQPGRPFRFPRKGALHMDRVPNEFDTFDPEDT